MKKLLLSLAALGLVASPAAAKPIIDFSIGLSTHNGRPYDRHYNDRDRYRRGEYRNYYSKPRCRYGEVAVQQYYTYRDFRWVCVDRDDLRRAHRR